MRGVASIVVLALSAAAASAQAPASEQPIARVVLFSASYCSACRALKAEVLPPLEERYGERLEIRDLDIQDRDNHRRLIQLEDRANVPPEARVIPTMLVGDTILAGVPAIREHLPALIDSAIEQGGTDWPDLDVDEAPPAPAEPQAAHDRRHDREPVWALFFHQTGCQECDRARLDLEWVRARHPQLVIEERNIYDHADLATWLADRADRDHLTTPAVFVGDEALIGREEITARALEALVERHAETGAAPPHLGYEQEAARRALVRRFQEMGPVAVVVAGLLDGINPCAFATLIFFVSYLTVSGRKGREILAVGAAFTAGVFLAYLAVGLGLYRALDLLGGALTTAGRWVLGATALLCAVLAALSFHDFLKARRGRLEDMSLNLPEGLRKRINAVIRRGRGARAFVLAAFLAGLAVSILELACTGQVYLPTIIFLTTVPELRGQAIAYLLLYNLLFVLPLAVVFVLVYYGTTQKQLVAFLRRRAAAVKLGMTALFAAMAAWLVASIGVL